MGILDTILGAIPAVGDLLGGIGSIFDLTGSDSSKNLSEQQLQGQQFLQQKALKLAMAGQKNARGDVLSYDPKTNTWTTTPSAETKGLITDADAAQRALLEQDVPRARQEAIRESSARGRESQDADAALARYRDYNPMTAERLSDDLYTQAAQGLREGYGQVSGDVSRQALRSGTGGGQLLDQLSRSYARDLANARVNSRVNALTTSSDLNKANRGSLLNEASTLRGLASGVPTVTAPTDTLNSQLSSLLNSARSGASGNVANAAGITGTGYQNLIGQNTNYYQDLGMAGGDLAAGLSGILKQFNTPSGSGSSNTAPTSSGRPDPYNPYAGNVSF
jgi:hypothetical protein